MFLNYFIITFEQNYCGFGDGNDYYDYHYHYRLAAVDHDEIGFHCIGFDHHYLVAVAAAVAVAAIGFHCIGFGHHYLVAVAVDAAAAASDFDCIDFG